MSEQKEKYCIMQIHSKNIFDFILMNWYILQFSK